MAGYAKAGEFLYKGVMAGGAALGAWWYGPNGPTSNPSTPNQPPPSPADQSDDAKKDAQAKGTSGSAASASQCCPPPDDDEDRQDQQTSERSFSKEETEGLRKLFGRGPDGAKNLLEQLKNGPVDLPAGVTQGTLQRYAQVAQSAIDAGIDKIGTQSLRLQAIRLLMR